jgi:hypothetical protein
VHSTDEFELGILTRSEPAVSGVSESSLLTGLDATTLQALQSLEDMRSAVNRIAAGANRMMSLFTPDLEPEIYDQTPFLDIAKRFVLARNFVKIRVLVGDGRRLARDGNRFVAMGRRLGSYIEMRMVQTPIAQRGASYLIADDRALVLRAASGSWSGYADFSSALNARALLNEFDVVWQANAPDDELQIASR